MYSKICSLLFVAFNLLAVGTAVQAQDLGNHPLGQNWQILSSDAIRVIYPAGMDERAQRIARLINYMDQHNRRSIGPTRRRIDMVLQNKTVNPNGYVALAPFRSEFYATPPQSNLLLGSLDWLDVLSIHEYRHVLQYLNAKRGLTRLFYWLVGEGGWSIGQAFAVPNWYSEGDAVITETALTNSGRGRSPFFTIEQRALAMAGKDYTYMKHRNGSFKSLLPDHYRLGYMILDKTREDFGNDITAKIHSQAASYRYIVYPFARAMRKHTGHGTVGMYKLAWEDKKADWAAQLKATELVPTTALTQKTKRTVTDYRYPRKLADGSVVVRKSSYKKTDALVQIKDGKERELCTIGFYNDEFQSLGAGKVAWAELSRDARRANLDYSDIVVYDLQLDRRYKLTDGSRYFSPSFSPDGKALAVVQVTPDQVCNILLLDPATGEVERQLDNPQNHFLSRTAWTPDGKHIVSIAKQNSQLALVKIDVATGAVTQLTPWSAHTMESPSVIGGEVFFNASYSGIDNIFKTDLGGSKQVQQVTAVPIGAFEPDVSADGKSVVFTEFTEMGYVVSEQQLGQAPAQRAGGYRIVEPADMPQYQTVANEAEGGNILAIPGGQALATYPSKPYSGLLRGLKLHSWGVSPSVSTPALSVGMTNMLNDLTVNLAGSVNRNEGNAATYSAAVELARYYPAFSLAASSGERQADFYSQSDSLATLKYNEQIVGGSMYVPLGWLSGNYFSSLRPSIGVNYRKLTDLKVEGDNLPDNDFASLDLGLSFRKLRRRAYQNVGPRAGVGIDIAYSQSLNGSSNERLTGSGVVYLPGIGPNHNIQVKLAYQREPLANQYQYADVFEYPRGYGAPINDEFTNLSVTYGLPLFYPDFGAAGQVYFKRVRANLFYDSGTGKNTLLDRKENYRSAGFELILDNKYFNLIDIGLGLRQSFLLEDDLRNPDRKAWFEVFAVTAL